MTTIFESNRILVIDQNDWEYVERKKGKTAVAVIATTEDGQAILTEQRREPVKRRVIDWPAGLVGDEEGHTDPAETARKELEEETGYTCDRVELLAKGPTSPGITSEIVALYRAHGVRKRGEGGGIGGEDITVHTVPIGDLPEWLAAREREGMLVDLKLWGGLYFLTRG